jgi:signal transduction histidine kinase
LPGAEDIAHLVDEFRGAGLQVVLEVHGTPGEVAPATGLALYRITQEALANVVKHAPGAGADIVLEVGAEARLRVHNPVSEPRQSDGGTGMGLGGMRERATLLGGWLRAGPDENGGWLVECAIPR